MFDSTLEMLAAVAVLSVGGYISGFLLVGMIQEEYLIPKSKEYKGGYHAGYSKYESGFLEAIYKSRPGSTWNPDSMYKWKLGYIAGAEKYMMCVHETEFEDRIKNFM